MAAASIAFAASAQPVFAQNAVWLTVTAEVVESPLARTYGGASELSWIGSAAGAFRLGDPSRRVELADGLAAVSTQMIEPGRLRARLEYVGN